MEPYYFDSSKYDSYLDQLGIKYPNAPTNGIKRPGAPAAPARGPEPQTNSGG